MVGSHSVNDSPPPTPKPLHPFARTGSIRRTLASIHLSDLRLLPGTQPVYLCRNQCTGLGQSKVYNLFKLILRPVSKPYLIAAKIRKAGQNNLSYLPIIRAFRLFFYCMPPHSCYIPFAGPALSSTLYLSLKSTYCFLPCHISVKDLLYNGIKNKIRRWFHEKVYVFNGTGLFPNNYKRVCLG